jgi:hypothetical protein
MERVFMKDLVLEKDLRYRLIAYMLFRECRNSRNFALSEFLGEASKEEINAGNKIFDSIEPEFFIAVLSDSVALDRYDKERISEVIFEKNIDKIKKFLIESFK